MSKPQKTDWTDCEDWKKSKLVTITLPVGYWRLILQVIRKHEKEGNRLGWPSWMEPMFPGWSFDQIRNAISYGIRKQKTTKQDVG